MAENRMEFSIVATDQGATAKLRDVAKATGGVTAASKTATPALLLTKNAFAELTAKLDPMESSLVRVGASLLHVKRSWTKVALMAGGLGVAALGAAAAFLIWQKRTEAQRKRQEELAKTLDKTTGAITQQTRELLASRIVEEGVAAAANKFGVSLDLVAEAASGSEDALAQIREQIDGAGQSAVVTSVMQSMLGDKTERMAADTKIAAEKVKMLAEVTWEMEAAVMSSGTATERQAVMQERANRAAEKGKDAIKAYQDAVKAATDPVFALFSATQDVAKAQEDYNAAVAESGPDSAAAQAAVVDLAKAELGLKSAANDVNMNMGEARTILEQLGASGQLSADELAKVTAALEGAVAASAGLRDVNIQNALGPVNATRPGLAGATAGLSSKGNSQLMAAQGGSTGAGSMVMQKLAPQQLNVRVAAGDGSLLTRWLMSALRVEIAKAGGSVQKAMGKR